MRFKLRAESRLEVLNRAVLVIASLGIYGIFRLVLSDKWSANQSADFWHYYYPLACNLLSGSGYVIKDAFCTMYPPGYPLFLAFFLYLSRAFGFSDENAFALLVGLMVVAIPQAAYSLGKIVVERKIALLGTMTLLIYPPYIWMTKQPNSELPFSLLLISMVAALLRTVQDPRVRYGYAALMGLLAGVMTLFRPIAILIGFVVALLTVLLAYNWRITHKMAFMGILVATNVLTVAPWSIYASVNKQETVIVASSGLLGIVDGLAYYYQPSPTQERSYVPASARALMKDIYDRRSEIKQLRDVVVILGEAIQERPIAVLQLFAVKALRVWYGTDSQWLEKELFLVQLPFVASFATGLFLLRKKNIQQRIYVIVAIGILLYTWLMSIAVLSIARYMTPTMILAVPAWGMAINILWYKLPSFFKVH
jgi:4-amino-4-deoxy-L-arabinose transferase-like glycosyltransferase